jgi:hypothetical protein
MAKILVNGIEIEIPDTTSAEEAAAASVEEDEDCVEFEESSRESYSKAGKSGAMA